MNPFNCLSWAPWRKWRVWHISERTESYLGGWRLGEGKCQREAWFVKSKFHLPLDFACGWYCLGNFFFFFFFSRKVILMRVGATAGKCLAQSLMLPPPHTLAQTPFDWLTGTGAPDPSWCSVLCSLCQSKLTSEMKPAPYACSKLCCGFFIVTCLLGILLYCCDFHSTWRFRGQFGVDSQNTL